jgi:DNA-binding CsgD family transcriptional regulator
MEQVKGSSEILRGIHQSLIENSPGLIDQLSELFSPGSFFYYILDHKQRQPIFIHPFIENVLKIKITDFTTDYHLKDLSAKEANLVKQKEVLVNSFFNERIGQKSIYSYKAIYLEKLTGFNAGPMVRQQMVLSATEKEILQSLIVYSDLSFISLTQSHRVSFLGYNEHPSWYNIDPENPSFETFNFASIFTKKEKEILKLLGKGMSSSEVANQSLISEKTLQTHKKNILYKSGCKNTTELLAKCAREGVI